MKRARPYDGRASSHGAGSPLGPFQVPVRMVAILHVPRPRGGFL